MQADSRQHSVHRPAKRFVPTRVDPSTTRLGDSFLCCRVLDRLQSPLNRRLRISAAVYPVLSYGLAAWRTASSTSRRRHPAERPRQMQPVTNTAKSVIIDDVVEEGVVKPRSRTLRKFCYVDTCPGHLVLGCAGWMCN